MSKIAALMLRFSTVGLMLVILAGCDSKDESSQTAPPESPEPVKLHEGQHIAVNGQSTKPAATFDTVLRCWQQDQKADAASALTVLDWTNPDLFNGHRCLKLSEQQFAALPTGERQALSTQALDMSNSIKELTRFVIEQAKTAKTQNRPDEAKKYQAALMEFGKQLSGDDKLLLIQMVGKAVLGLTQKELGEI
jgi:hypothetical protein